MKKEPRPSSFHVLAITWLAGNSNLDHCKGQTVLTILRVLITLTYLC